MKFTEAIVLSLVYIITFLIVGLGMDFQIGFFMGLLNMVIVAFVMYQLTEEKKNEH